MFWTLLATQDGTKAMYEFIIGKIREVRGKEKSTTSNEVSTNADEILKYKQLLDMGAITTEEYERKKEAIIRDLEKRILFFVIVFMTVIRASIKVVGALFIPFLRRKKVNYGGKENRRNHCPRWGTGV